MRLASLAFLLAQVPGLARGGSPPPAVAAAAATLDCREIATYRITYGVFGQVAEAKVTLSPEAASPAEGKPAPKLRAVGTGAGALLGLGRTEKRIETEMSAQDLAALRFTNVTTTRARTTVDTATQEKPGSLDLLRKRSGEADLAEKLTRSASILDPLAFLFKLRADLPRASTSYEVLDGRALWLVTVAAAVPDAAAPWLLRLEGRFDPVYWDGSADPQREARGFVLFLSSDRSHLPVRMVVPFVGGQIQADLIHLDRPTTPPPRPNAGLRWCQASRAPRAWAEALTKTMREVASKAGPPAAGKSLR